MSQYYYNGEIYNDDRLFVLLVQKCTIREDDEFIITSLHHEESPKIHKWCVATFRNVERYRAVRVDSFNTLTEALEYRKKVEPETPLISLGGKSMNILLSYNEYCKWKKEHNFKEYDYKKMFYDNKYSKILNTYNPVDTFYEKKK